MPPFTSPTARCCEECGSTKSLDTYNEDDEGNGGRLICDACIYKAASDCDKRTCVVLPARPEGYYHSPIGTFE